MVHSAYRIDWPFIQWCQSSRQILSYYTFVWLADDVLTLSTLSFWNELFHHWIWTCPLLQIEMSIKNQNRLPNRQANSVESDKTAHYDPSHQDLHCVHMYLVWFAGLKKLNCITKTYLYYFDPLKPHFYIVKLGFTGVYIIFLISAQNIDCGYSLEPPPRGGSNEYRQSMFWAEI